MAHPYRELVNAEAERAESDLAAFRARAISVVTTSSGVITLLTGLVTFAASKAEDDKGVPDGVIVLLALSFAALLIAAGLALRVNAAGTIARPGGQDLVDLTSEEGWLEHAANRTTEERLVAEVTVTYLVSVRKIADDAAGNLNSAICCQIVGLGFAAAAGVVAMLTIN